MACSADGTRMVVEPERCSLRDAVGVGECGTGWTPVAWKPRTRTFAVAKGGGKSSFGTSTSWHQPSLRYSGLGLVELWTQSEDDDAYVKDATDLYHDGGFVYDLGFSPVEDYLAVASGDGVVNIYDTKLTLQAHGLHVPDLTQWRLCWRPHGMDLLLSGCSDGSMIAWHLPSERHWIVPGHSAAIRCIRFRDDGRLFATVGQDGYVKVWDPEDPFAPKVEEKLGLLWLLSVEWVASDVVAVAADDGLVRIVSFDLHDQKVSSLAVPCHTGAVWDLAVNKSEDLDSTMLYSCGSDGYVAWLAVGQTVNLRQKKKRRGPAKPPSRLFSVRRAAEEEEPGRTEGPDGHGADPADDRSLLVFQKLEKGIPVETSKAIGKLNRVPISLPFESSNCITHLRLSPLQDDFHGTRDVLLSGLHGYFVVVRLTQDELVSRNTGRTKRTTTSSTTTTTTTTTPTLPKRPRGRPRKIRSPADAVPKRRPKASRKKASSDESDEAEILAELDQLQEEKASKPPPKRLRGRPPKNSGPSSGVLGHKARPQPTRRSTRNKPMPSADPSPTAMEADQPS